MAKSAAAATRKSLDRSEWIAGAIDALADEGVGGMCVEALAKRFGVTKGSFYWHFKDRRDLVGAVLSAWTVARIGEVDDEAAAGDGKARLLRLIAGDGGDRRDRREIAVELAVRDWARRDAQAAAAVEAVDRHRYETARRLFAAAGYGDDEAASRSRLLCAYRLGQRLLAGDRDDAQSAARERAIAELIAPSLDD